MKKIINKKPYDTETATKVYSWDNGEYTSFEYIEEALYRKRTGEFFIHGIGGAQTRYAETTSSGWSGGEAIIPLSYDDAATWAEEHMSSDQYEQCFGMSDDNERTVSFVLKETEADKLKAYAKSNGKTQADVIREFIATLDI